MSTDPLIIALRRMNDELLALKTAHQRGLGMIDFFKQSATVSLEEGAALLGQVTVRVEYVDAAAEGFSVIEQPLPPFPPKWVIAASSSRFYPGGAEWVYTYLGDIDGLVFQVTSTEEMASLTASINADSGGNT